MSEQAKEDTKNGKTAATPDQSAAVGTSEKTGNGLTEDELSKISGGFTQPHADSY